MTKIFLAKKKLRKNHILKKKDLIFKIDGSLNEFKQNQNLLKKEKPPQKLRKKTVRRNITIGRSKKNTKNICFNIK